MYFNIPKGKTPEELFEWCCETTEKLNRSQHTTKKEKKDNGDNTEA